MTLSIVILTWNSLDFCMSCLRSLSAAGWTDQRAEIIVVDNGSVDGTIDAVRERYPQVTLTRNPRNRGVAAGRNQGLRQASGEAILFLDVDTIVPPSAIEALLETLKEDGVGIVGPKLVSPAGDLQFTCRRFPTVLGKIGRRFPARTLAARIEDEELRFWDHATKRDVDYVIGACQLVRRDVVDSIGLLDERIFYGPEDVDYCLRAQLSGWRVVYQPLATVQHAERRITKRSGVGLLELRHGVAVLYFFAKHRYALSAKRVYERIQYAQVASHKLRAV